MLPEPTPKRVKRELDIFDESEELVEGTVRSLFALYPSNIAEHEVLAKVVVLNQLYSARVLDMHVKGLSKRIVASGLDRLLTEGSGEAVNAICACCNGKRYYSFATKYCSWHKPDFYCMWDGNVDEALWRYNKLYAFSKFKRYELNRDYSILRRVVGEFRTRFGLESLSFKDIDKFLWNVGYPLVSPNIDANPTQ